MGKGEKLSPQTDLRERGKAYGLYRPYTHHRPAWTHLLLATPVMNSLAVSQDCPPECPPDNSC